MFMLMMILLMFLLIPSMMLTLNFIFSKKNIINQEKSSPFECGFDPLSLNRQPFSIQFFLITLIFLIFDIEIILLVPLIPLNDSPSFSSILLVSFFMMILVLGLYFEYTEKSIDWKI